MACYPVVQKFDIPVFYFINHTVKNNLCDWLLPFITEIGSVYFIVALGLLLIIVNKKSVRSTGFLILAGTAVSETISSILKVIFARPRPAAIIEDIYLLCHKSYTYSFPSGHSALIFTAATIIALSYPRLKWPAFGIAAIVAFSRVYVGAHFPLDVIAGACLGMFIGYVITYLAGKDKEKEASFKSGLKL